MDRDRLLKLLRQVRSGKMGVEAAAAELRLPAMEQLEFATLDLHRTLRRGFPEVVYGPGKTPAQIAEIMDRMRKAHQTVLVTRVGPDVHAVVRERHPEVEYHEIARALVLRSGRRPPSRPGIVIITAGTADQAVGAEAALTVELLGHRPTWIRDVGVAGIHRLLAHRRTLAAARVIIAVAGMEGALPSVLSGLTDCPVIGVPTSAGYGAGGKGEAALLAMLNSCASGLTVVNIDNGFGAGIAAALINRPRRRSSGRS